MKDSLIEKVLDKAARNVNSDRDKELDWRNNAYNMRSQAIGDKLRELDDHDDSEKVKMAHLMPKHESDFASHLSAGKLRKMEVGSASTRNKNKLLPQIISPNNRNKFQEIGSLTEGSGSRFGIRRQSVPVR